MKYFIFWSPGYGGDRMEAFESVADMEIWYSRQPDTVEISFIIHGMEIDRTILNEVVK